MFIFGSMCFILSVRLEKVICSIALHEVAKGSPNVDRFLKLKKEGEETQLVSIPLC